MNDTALTDQILAATREAETILHRAAGYVGGRIQPATDATSAALIKRLLPDGHLTRTCAHAAGGPRPMSVTAAMPGVGWCARCVLSPATLAATATYAASTDCDACTLQSNVFYQVMVAIDAVTFVGSVCGACYRRARAGAP
jgi:hypothetical protein